jgi:hypothetical protein
MEAMFACFGRFVRAWLGATIATLIVALVLGLIAPDQVFAGDSDGVIGRKYQIHVDEAGGGGITSDPGNAGGSSGGVTTQGTDLEGAPFRSVPRRELTSCLFVSIRQMLVFYLAR